MGAYRPRGLRGKDLRRSGAREKDGRVARKARLVSGLKDMEKDWPSEMEGMVNDG